MKRRVLLSSLMVLGALAGAKATLVLTRPRDRLATDPEGERYQYVDGWIVER